MYSKKRIYRDIINSGLEKDILFDVPMKKYNSWRIGGKADFFCIPSNQEILIRILIFALDHNIPIYVIGNGSNIWIPDKGIKGFLVRIANTIDKIEYSDKMIKVGAGILLPVLVKDALNNNLGGIEFAAHIPGSLGGAIINNASFANYSMSDIVEEIVLFDCNNRDIRTLNKKQFLFCYRGINLDFKKFVILNASLLLSESDRESSILKIKKFYEQRKNTQPIEYFSAGCVFKNPKEKSAGYLIEKAGAKGLVVGDAQVSTKHANFIINRGNATSDEILKLIEKVEKIVYESFGITLEREINFIGVP